MDVAHPIKSVIPSAHGAVLAVLACAGQPLTGRTVAALTGGQVSSTRTKGVLAELVTAGVVTCDPHPPANLYRLNHAHVAYEAIVLLATMSDRLRSRMSDAVKGWKVRPVAVWLFGSAARRDGTVSSDLDVLVVRPDDVPDDDERWNEQTLAFAESASAWSGNDCRIVELSEREIGDWVRRDEPLVRDLRDDAVTLWGVDASTLLSQRHSENGRRTESGISARRGSTSRRRGSSSTPRS